MRIAVGARPAALAFMIVRQAMVYALLGIGMGVVATFGVGRIMHGMLYGVQPEDLATITLMAVGLTAVALVACSLPAAKAARVDPVVALRRD